MPTNFPTSVDNFTNPTANDSLNLPSHSTQHANANDAIEAVETYLLNGGQGLTLIKKQTIGTGVSTAVVTGAFSATYDNYLIKVSGGAHSAGGSALLTLQLGSTPSGVYSTLVYASFAAGSVAGVNVSNGSVFNYVGAAQTNGLHANITINDPFLNKSTLVEASFYDTANSGRTTGYLNDTTSYTQFTIGCPTGTLTGGTIYVYGYGIGQ